MYKDKSGLSCSGDRSQMTEWAEWIIKDDQLLELLALILNWLLQPIYIQAEYLPPCCLCFLWTSTDHVSF